MNKVFISHSSIDKPFVRKLKRDLDLNYIDTWVDEDEMFPGDSLLSKLEDGLKESTHFVIVLSPNSVNSQWVEIELDNALEQVEESTIRKIIPIMYRECKMPESLDGIFYANLSSEIMHFKKGWIEFSGDNYEYELNKIVKAIVKTTEPLTKEEKEDLSSITPIQGDEENGIPTFRLRVIGFKSKSKFLTIYITEKEKKKYSKDELLKLSPVVLPKFLQQHLKDLGFGDSITLRIKGGKETSADFAKFSQNNTQIAIPKNVRDALGLKNKTTYKISIATKSVIEFIEVDDE